MTRFNEVQRMRSADWIVALVIALISIALILALQQMMRHEPEPTHRGAINSISEPFP